MENDCSARSLAKRGCLVILVFSMGPLDLRVCMYEDPTLPGQHQTPHDTVTVNSMLSALARGGQQVILGRTCAVRTVQNWTSNGKCKQIITK